MHANVISHTLMKQCGIRRDLEQRDVRERKGFQHHPEEELWSGMDWAWDGGGRDIDSPAYLLHTISDIGISGRCCASVIEDLLGRLKAPS